MAFEVRLDPDDGTPPATLGFDEYQRLFPALVAASPSFLAPLKRFRGPHARFDIPSPDVAAVLEELQGIRRHAKGPQPFLDALEQIARKAFSRGSGLQGRSP